MAQIQLEQLNHKEALRYLGYGGHAADDMTQDLLMECEQEVIATAKPRFVYKVTDFTVEEDGIHFPSMAMVLPGNSIKELLEGCDKAVLMAVTISDDIDRLIRKTQIMNMAKAVVMDSMSSVAAEEACNQAEQIIHASMPDKYMTFRFGIGYGDLPLSLQPQFVEAVGATKQIGIHVADSYMMTPTKSVTAVIGLSDHPIEKKRSGCATCNMKGTCQYRGRGEYCYE